MVHSNFLACDLNIIQQIEKITCLIIIQIYSWHSRSKESVLLIMPVFDCSQIIRENFKLEKFKCKILNR